MDGITNPSQPYLMDIHNTLKTKRILDFSFVYICVHLVRRVVGALLTRLKLVLPIINYAGTAHPATVVIALLKKRLTVLVSNGWDDAGKILHTCKRLSLPPAKCMP